MLSQIKPVVIRDRIAPIKIWREKNVYIYDFGINTVGVCQLKITGRHKQKVKLTYSESAKEHIELNISGADEVTVNP